MRPLYTYFQNAIRAKAEQDVYYAFAPTSAWLPFVVWNFFPGQPQNYYTGGAIWYKQPAMVSCYTLDPLDSIDLLTKVEAAIGPYLTPVTIDSNYRIMKIEHLGYDHGLDERKDVNGAEVFYSRINLLIWWEKS